MATRDQLRTLAEPAAAALVSIDQVQREAAVDRALSRDGSPRQVPDFRELRSPDGSVWRERISNTGTVTWTKVTP